MIHHDGCAMGIHERYFVQEEMKQMILELKREKPSKDSGIIHKVSEVFDEIVEQVYLGENELRTIIAEKKVHILRSHSYSNTRICYRC